MDGRGWVDVGDLEVGDVVVTADGVVFTLQEKLQLEDEIRTWSLTVDGNHTFFVGDGDGDWVVVHNAEWNEKDVQQYIEDVLSGRSRTQYLPPLMQDCRIGCHNTVPDNEGIPKRQTDLQRMIAMCGGNQAKIDAIYKIYYELKSLPDMASNSISFGLGNIPNNVRARLGYDIDDPNYKTGPCAAWVDEAMQSLKKLDINEHLLKIREDESEYNSGMYAGHNFLRIEIESENGIGWFYIDNGYYGGRNHVFFYDELMSSGWLSPMPIYTLPSELIPQAQTHEGIK